MLRACLLVLVLSLLPLGIARAIENVANAEVPYNNNAPTNADITNWTSGWPQPSVQPQGTTVTTGWNYSGSVAGNSAVYLGGGWVLTAAHVGAGDFSLNNVKYPMVPNSATILNSVQVPGQAAPTSPQADLVLFQVSPAPSLPPLVLRTNDPVAGKSKIAMFGYGHDTSTTDRSPTWGYNPVTSYVNFAQTITATVNGTNYTFYTNDFVTLTQGSTANDYQVEPGDSGGPDFIYNSTTSAWELAGINEVQYSNPNASGMVQLDTYLPQINAIMALQPQPSPAMPGWALGLLGASLFAVASPLVSRAHLPSKASSKG